jgi:hypothetical protein
MLNLLPYRPSGPVNSNIYRSTINSTGLNLKTERAGPPDTILEKDHSMTILSKFGSN